MKLSYENRFLLFALMLLKILLESYSQDIRGLNVYGTNISNTVPGKQVALFIAINDYKEWLSLQFPVKDALTLRNILADKYWFTDIIELYNEKATKASILKQLDELTRDLKQEDSLFIYFAGHGYKDDSTEIGFLIPHDAGLDTYAQLNWIPSSQIRAYLAKMRAKHVLLIADSCFSGDILNSYRSITPTISNEYFREAYSRRSRQVMTSGSSEVVPDKSSFAQSLIRCLEQNSQEYLDPLMIYLDIRLSVHGTMPLFGTLVGADHQEGGSFIFFLKSRPDLTDNTNKNDNFHIYSDTSKDKIITPATIESTSNKNGRILLPAKIYGINMYIDGAKVELTSVPGTNYLESSEIPPGWHKIKLTGKYPYTDTIEIRPGGRTELTAWRDIALSEALRQKQSYEKTLANRPKRMTIGYITSGVGALVLSSLIILDKIYHSRIENYDPSNPPSHNFLLDYYLGWTMPISLMIGIPSLATGAVLLSGPSERKLNDTIQRLNNDIKMLGSY